MANNLLLKLIISGSNTGAIRSLKEVESAAKQAVGNVNSFFAAAGVSLTLAGVVRLADEYKNMTGLLQNATRYTGDFDAVLGMLIQSAAGTRSALGATVELYVRMAPALQALGMQGQRAVGIISAINGAVMISGTSAQAGEAAIRQLGQAMNSVLRGDELTSVIEQAPMLAMAIADGLGVPIGALREMGAAGALTADKVAVAMEKMSGSIASQVQNMPVTVSQSLTLLRDSVMIYVGLTDNATNSTSVLAGVVREVANAFREGHPVLTVFSESLKIMVNGLDGVYRLLKITAMGMAAYTLASQQAMGGDFSAARDTLRELSKDVNETLTAQLLTDRAIQTSATDTVKRREMLEEQLKTAVEKAERFKQYVAGQAASATVTTSKNAVDAQIADQQRLVDAVRSAWKESLSEMDRATKAQESKLAKAQDYKQRGDDSAFSARTKNLSPEAQLSAKASRMSDLQGQATFELLRAKVAVFDGDFKKFETQSAVAEKKLLAALALAEDIGNANAIQEISGDLAKLEAAGAAVEGKKADRAKTLAAEQATLLNNLQADLVELQQLAREIEVKVDAEAANNTIAGLKNQLAALQDKTVTVTVNTVRTGGSESGVYDFKEYIDTPDIPARAYGGRLPGWAPHDRSDNVIYRGTPGEWVIQRPAVRYYGAGLMAMINAMRLPKFATGGQLGGVQNLKMPRFSAAEASSDAPSTVLDMGALGRIRVRAAPTTASDVESVLKRAALRYGR